MASRFGDYSFGGFGLEIGNNEYYPPGNQVIFGAETAHNDFIIPMARFSFFNPDGSPASAPTIYVRMGSAFNTQVLNTWQDASNVFAPGGNVNASEETLFNLLGQISGTAFEAIQKQILSGVTNATGYIATAGLNGKQQVEFIKKKFLNNFQQLIYGGTTFRRFSLPFSMKPTSYEEAQAMWDIVSSFRVASGPKAIPSGETNIPTGGVNLADTVRDPNSLSDEQKVQYDADLTSRNAQTVARSADVLTFGYPDLTQFDLVLYKGSQEITLLFRSEACVIESVSVDYGSGGKMKFFDAQGDGNHYPTDVNLTLSLREIRLPTAGQMGLDYQNSRVIL